jgi:cytochrome c
MRFAILVIALVGISAVSVHAKSVGGYTNAQAARGATVYTQYCAVCHGANLQGEAGTPLKGRTFLQAYGAGTAAQLYDFISRQMPLNAPGSLSQKQYLDVSVHDFLGWGPPSFLG